MTGRTPAPRRLVLAHPYCWPHVRRGAERVLDDLARHLAARGHRVTVVSSSPDVPREEERDGTHRVLLAPWTRRRWLPGVDGTHAFTLRFRDWLRSEGRDADVLHCLSHHDAAGGALAGRAVPPMLLHFMGIPVRGYFRRKPLEHAQLALALRRVRATACLSRFATEALARDFGVHGRLLPSCVDTTRFTPRTAPPPGPPVLLMAAALDEPRKGALCLARAWVRLRTEWPTLRLQFSGSASAATRDAILATIPAAHRDDVTFLGVGAPGALVSHYRAATVLVLPSVWEALGNVLIEALACGVPVVAARHAGPPDILEGHDVGALFDPGGTRTAPTDDAACAAAIAGVLARCDDPGLAARCRARAEAFGWDAWLPHYEATYATLA